MDVRPQDSGMERLGGPRRRLGAIGRRGMPRGTGSQWIGEVLGELQAQELRIARGFAECRGLSTEQLEDIYQETSLALLRRPYQSEEHLLYALRRGIKQRALNSHRNERTRRRKLAEHAPGMQLVAEAAADEQWPETAAITKQDRLIAAEFIAELTKDERRVFGGLVEGMQYRAIAAAQGIALNEARNASRSIERKRERFQLLYDTGRLCGFRSVTIQALQRGEATSDELAERAYAHLDNCAHCRSVHKTNAARLRRSFQDQVGALLPLPMLAGHIGWLSRIDLRLRAALQRLLPDAVPASPSGARDGAIALFAGGGVAAKAVVTVATVAAVAGGIGATQALHSDKGHRHVIHASKRPGEPRRASLASVGSASITDTAHRPGLTSSVSENRASDVNHPGAHPQRRATPRAAGGFGFLGVPAQQRARPVAAVASTTRAPRVVQHGGGPFTP